MAEIRVQKVTPDYKKRSRRELYATVCFYYPQYRLDEVQKLPARDIQLLLDMASRIEAQQMYSLTQIAAAPHTEKGKGVKSLLDHFKKIGKF